MVIITFLKRDRPTMVEDGEQGIIVEDIDTCASSIGAAMNQS
jgi:hypothetical protein